MGSFHFIIKINLDLFSLEWSVSLSIVVVVVVVDEIEDESSELDPG